MLHAVHVAVRPAQRPHRERVQVNRHQRPELHRDDGNVRRADRRPAVRGEQGQVPGPGRVSIRRADGVADMPTDVGVRRGPGGGCQESEQSREPRRGRGRRLRGETTKEPAAVRGTGRLGRGGRRRRVSRRCGRSRRRAGGGGVAVHRLQEARHAGVQGG